MTRVVPAATSSGDRKREAKVAVTKDQPSHPDVSLCSVTYATSAAGGLESQLQNCCQLEPFAVAIYQGMLAEFVDATVDIPHEQMIRA